MMDGSVSCPRPYRFFLLIRCGDDGSYAEKSSKSHQISFLDVFGLCWIDGAKIVLF